MASSLHSSPEWRVPLDPLVAYLNNQVRCYTLFNTTFPDKGLGHLLATFNTMSPMTYCLSWQTLSWYRQTLNKQTTLHNQMLKKHQTMKLISMEPQRKLEESHTPFYMVSTDSVEEIKKTAEDFPLYALSKAVQIEWMLSTTKPLRSFKMIRSRFLIKPFTHADQKIIKQRMASIIQSRYAILNYTNIQKK